MIGLMNVCQGTSQDLLKDGLRAVAWNTLTKASLVEKDVRVLEALKLLSVIESTLVVVLLQSHAASFYNS